MSRFMLGPISLLTSPPTVSSLNTTTGSTDGGTAVTITGQHFLGGVTGVTFGGTAATSVVVVNDTTITCVAPAHAAGAVSVAVTSLYGTGTKASAFTYAVPGVASISFVAQGTAASGALAFPTAAHAGDLLVLAVLNSAGTAITGTPSGFTNLTNPPSSTSSVQLYAKIVTAADVANKPSISVTNQGFWFYAIYRGDIAITSFSKASAAVWSNQATGTTLTSTSPSGVSVTFGMAAGTSGTPTRSGTLTTASGVHTQAQSTAALYSVGQNAGVALSFTQGDFGTNWVSLAALSLT